MNTPHDHHTRIAQLIKPRPTDIPGLTMYPNLEPDVSNDQDMPPFGWIGSAVNTPCNHMVLRDIVSRMGQHLHAVMEIGVNREGDNSLTKVLLNERPQGSFYLGIDLDDKSYLDDASRNTWTLRCNSADQQVIRSWLSSRGVDRIDLLLIDGWHSVNACINDWRYSDLLSGHGVVVMHDTNTHPGPVALYNAIDEQQYIKQLHCTGHDHGIAVALRRGDLARGN